jgi:hypothetical protein
MSDDSIHPLKPSLDHLQTRLETTLDEVCDEISIGEAETSELIRIEEALAYASQVAKQAVSLRRRIDADEEAPPPA